MNRNIFISFVVLLAGMLACAVPGGMSPTPVVVTQVVVVPNEQEQQQVQASPTLPFPTAPVTTDTSVPTGTATSTATVTPTATSSGPGVTLIKDANCRKGPGTKYDVITSYYEGETLQIVGRNPDYDNTWWYVKMPTGGNCWVSLATGQAYGDFDAIPTVVP